MQCTYLPLSKGQEKDEFVYIPDPAYHVHNYTNHLELTRSYWQQQNKLVLAWFVKKLFITLVVCIISITISKDLCYWQCCFLITPPSREPPHPLQNNPFYLTEKQLVIKAFCLLRPHERTYHKYITAALHKLSTS